VFFRNWTAFTSQSLHKSIEEKFWISLRDTVVPRCVAGRMCTPPCPPHSSSSPPPLCSRLALFGERTSDIKPSRLLQKTRINQHETSDIYFSFIITIMFNWISQSSFRIQKKIALYLIDISLNTACTCSMLMWIATLRWTGTHCHNGSRKKRCHCLMHRIGELRQFLCVLLG